MRIRTYTKSADTKYLYKISGFASHDTWKTFLRFCSCKALTVDDDVLPEEAYVYGTSKLTCQRVTFVRFRNLIYRQNVIQSITRSLSSTTTRQPELASSLTQFTRLSKH